jgi:hypothetical protein
MGAFAPPLVVLNWLWARGRRGLAEPTLYWIVAGAGLAWLPWLVFLTLNHADWLAQLTVFGNRLDLLDPGFYVQNILGEAARYMDVLTVPDTDDPRAPISPASQLIAATAIWPAAAYVVWRSRRTQAVGDRLVWSSLAVSAGLLLVVDQTKTPLYAIVLVPSICLSLAVCATAAWAWAGNKSRRAYSRLATRAVIACLGLVVATEGLRAYSVYLGHAARVSQYLGVGLQLEEALSPDSRLLGPERWWWAVHNHPYVSLRGVWWQWWAAASADPGRLPQFAAWVNSTQADTIIVNDNIRDDIRAFPDALQRQFWEFVSRCTTPVLDLNDASYLRIEVDRITRPSPELELCGGGPQAGE